MQFVPRSDQRLPSLVPDYLNRLDVINMSLNHVLWLVPASDELAVIQSRNYAHAV